MKLGSILLSLVNCVYTSSKIPPLSYSFFPRVELASVLNTHIVIYARYEDIIVDEPVYIPLYDAYSPSKSVIAESSFVDTDSVKGRISGIFLLVIFHNSFCYIFFLYYYLRFI